MGLVYKHKITGDLIAGKRVVSGHYSFNINGESVKMTRYILRRDYIAYHTSNDTWRKIIVRQAENYKLSQRIKDENKNTL